MSETKIEFVSAIIIASADAEGLADFYRRGLGIALEPSAHGEGPPHFECELGDLHFAVHPTGPVQPDCVAPRIRIAFAVRDLDAALERLRLLGTVPKRPPVERGFARMVAVEDPDGNLIELTQLTARWLAYIGSRDVAKRDVTKAMGVDTA